MRVLHSFDLDDTLFHHSGDGARVRVIDESGAQVASLRPEEWVRRGLGEGQRFDFSEFKSTDVFVRPTRPNRQAIHRMKMSHGPGRKVEILTARSDMDDGPAFVAHVRRQGISRSVHVRRAGNHGNVSQDSKYEVLVGLVKRYGFKEVHLYDDHLKNMGALRRLKRKFPFVQVFGHHARRTPAGGVRFVSKRY